MAEWTLTTFARVVGRMRAEQRGYFHTSACREPEKRQAHLRRAVELEREVDAALKEIGRGTPLFDGMGDET